MPSQERFMRKYLWFTVISVTDIQPALSDNREEG
jgi:hypothetical protein